MKLSTAKGSLFLSHRVPYAALFIHESDCETLGKAQPVASHFHQESHSAPLQKKDGWWLFV